MHDQRRAPNGSVSYSRHIFGCIVGYTIGIWDIKSGLLSPVYFLLLSICRYIHCTILTYSSISSKSAIHYKNNGGRNRTELATSYWPQWRGALCHILHTRRWHRTVNWHWEQLDPLQLDRTWEEQSVHQHCSAGCQLSWEVNQECCNSTVQPHTTWWVVYKEYHAVDISHFE